MTESNEKQKDPSVSTRIQAIPFFIKVLAVLIIIGILYMVVFGGLNVDNPLTFIQNLIILGIFSVVFVFILQKFFNFGEAKPFSPKEQKHARLVTWATLSVPPAIRGKKLILYGNALVQGYPFGSITGMLLLPIFAGRVKIDDRGKPVLKSDPVTGKRVPEFVKELDPKKDFEYFFVVKHPGILSSKFTYARVRADLVMSTNGDVYVKTANLVPHMSSLYVYPFEQVQADPTQIMNQNMIENIIMTHDYFLDLVANTTEHALQFNPVWKQAERIGEERLYNPESMR